MSQGWQLVYMVIVERWSPGSVSAAHRASLSSGCAVTSPLLEVVLCAEAITTPLESTSSDPYGNSPVSAARASISIASHRWARSWSVSGSLRSTACPLRPPVRAGDTHRRSADVGHYAAGPAERGSLQDDHPAAVAGHTVVDEARGERARCRAGGWILTITNRRVEEPRVRVRVVFAGRGRVQVDALAVSRAQQREQRSGVGFGGIDRDSGGDRYQQVPDAGGNDLCQPR
jgi:hypothetical protein